MLRNILLGVAALLIVPLFFLLGCGSSTDTTTTTTSPSTTATTVPLASTKIYFQTSHSPWSIYKMSPDGTSQEVLNLTGTGTASLEDPAVAPDNSKIAYVKMIAGKAQLHIANLDGSGEQQLTSSSEGSADPCWAPDSSKIIFNRAGAKIMTITPAGTEQVLLSGLTGAARPSYLNSSTILYMCNFGGGTMRVFKYDGSSSTDLGSVELDPAVTYAFFTPKGSPDGSKIAFCSNKNCLDSSGQQRELYYMNADGTGVVQLTHRTSTEATKTYDNFRPTWSPSGNQIAFYTNLKGDAAGTTWDIMLINISGTGEVNLTNNSYPDKNPSWQ